MTQYNARDNLSVTRVYWDYEVAKKEAKRLNELNGHLGCVYWVTPTRVES